MDSYRALGIRLTIAYLKIDRIVTVILLITENIIKSYHNTPSFALFYFRKDRKHNQKIKVDFALFKKDEIEKMWDIYTYTSDTQDFIKQKRKRKISSFL